MNKNSRTNNVFRNIIGGVGGQLFTSILMFVCRTVFIKLLGAAYLGVNGLFSNILSMLSLAELGIGPAIVFSMYKPIAEEDELHIAKLMNFYKSAYRVVALVVAIIGVSIVPFLKYLIKDTNGIENIQLIYLLVLLSTVASYILAYKGSMLTADQKSYVVVIIRNIFAVVQNIAQIIVLIITGNFILYLITSIITGLTANIVQAIYVDKKYPFLVKYKHARIDKAERTDIIKRVQGMMMHKIGGFILNGTDNIVISKFVGIISVGLYSNYLMIINLVKGYVAQISGAMSASIGNLIASESKEKSYSIFKTTLFLYFWIYALCFICFWVLFQPFITVWLGKNYLLANGTLFVVLINFYLYGIQDALNTFTNATGLFWENRHKPIAECIINLGVSIVLASKIGIIGVFIGTTASFICTFWVNAVLLYKKHFHKNVIFYFIRFTLYLILTIGVAIGIETLCSILFGNDSILCLIPRAISCILLPNILFIILFNRTEEFKYCLGILKKLIAKKKKF